MLQLTHFRVLCTALPIWLIVMSGAAPAVGGQQTTDVTDASLSTVSSETTAGEAKRAKAVFEMSIEELMDVPVVVSTSRQPRKITESSSAVSVITADDIKHSGLTSIPQILQFACGVDVLQLSRWRYAVGVRGLHGAISDRMQLLVNGRLADSSVYGGPEFYSLPVLVDDIERIEIVRGPSGGAWGANAFTGVVNVITKKPEDVLGYFGSSTVTEHGDTYTHVRWAEKQGPWRWRTSVGYENLKSSDDAIDGGASYESFKPTLNGLMGFGGFTVRDFSRTLRVDTEAIRSVSEQTDVSLGAGYSHLETSDYEQLGYFPMQNARNEMLRSFARADHKFDDGSSGHLQWFGNFWNANWPQYGQFHTAQNDFEGQYNFSPAEAHQVSVGGNVRWTRIDTHREAAQQYTYTGEPFDEYVLGGFLVDRWQVSDKWGIEGQVRTDWYSETQTDWAGRLAALYAIDEKKDHTLRFAVAKSFRTPLSSLREVRGGRLPVGGPLYAINVDLPANDLHNEETWSLETGYRGRLAEGVRLSVDTYYQRFEKLIGYRSTTDGFGLAHYQADNIDGADSWGTEAELAWEGKKGRLSVWYAYNDFEEDRYQQCVRSFLPARHKVGLMGRLYLPEDWTLTTNYRFTNTTPGNPSPTVDDTIGSSHRLDMNISKKIAKGKGELMFGVSDLLNKAGDPICSSGELTGQEVPGRTFFMQMRMRF